MVAATMIIAGLVQDVGLIVANAGSTWIAPAIVAAIVAAAVSLTTFGLSGRRARLDRQRQILAEAFEAVVEYREYPYIVRRRNKDDAAEERKRISGELSKVQAKLNAYKARLRVEAPTVGESYATLVAETRRVAGAAIHDAWNQEPVAADAAMHAPLFDFSELDKSDDEYLHAVADHLSWIYTPVARKLRERCKKTRKSPATA